MKKTMLKAAFFLSAGVWMTACGSSKQAAQAIDLTGEWNIVAVNGEKVQAANMPYIGLDMKGKKVYAERRMQPHDGNIRG